MCAKVSKFLLKTGILLTLLLPPSFATAQNAPAFSDVSSGHYAYEAIQYLKSQGIIDGYSDGTFKPGNKVNRAEAMKFIIAPLVSEEDLAKYLKSDYTDVPEDAWFLKYVEYGRDKSIIDPPSKKPAFLGANPVIKVEFFKMLLLANNIDPNSYSEIRLPLSSDVTNPDEWYYPYMRYGIASSMTMISKDGTLNPAAQLTRGDTALLLYRLLMYKEGKRTQALLSEAETEILLVLGNLEKNNVEQAEFASARALLAARGAHASKPDNTVVRGALKITEAFRALVRSYRAGLGSDYAETERLAKDAWHLAAKSIEINPDIGNLAQQVQAIAGEMAESARTLMSQ